MKKSFKGFQLLAEQLVMDARFLFLKIDPSLVIGCNKLAAGIRF
jgi:type VI protein secretion system component VasA